MSCPVCGGVGWMEAGPTNEVNPAAEVTISTNPRVDWCDATQVPCWACWPSNQKVMTL